MSIKNSVLYCVFGIIITISLESFSSTVHEALHCSSDMAILSIHEMKNAFISYVQDTNGTVFLIKQKKHTADQFGRILEVLSAHIAEQLEIPAHHVAIIPAGVVFPGKKYDAFPATIHSIVPGKMIIEYGDMFDQFCIEQKCSSCHTYDEKGLTRSVIKNMSLHASLPKIAALDTFIGNKGRHRRNLFYDQGNDEFYAIDMDHTFDKNLAAIACNHLQTMMNDSHINFSRLEIDALLSYRNTLALLLDMFPPYILCHMMHYLLKQAYPNLGENYTSNLNKKVALRETVIDEIYSSCLCLIKELDKVITYYKDDVYVISIQ